MTPHHSHVHHHHDSASDLALAFGLNLGFALFEIAGGIWTGSLAILSDALHDLGDSVSLGLSWYLARISSRQQDAQFSYGYRRFSLLGALINMLILIGGGLIVLWRAIPALWTPSPPDARGMMFLALVGIAVNGAAVLRLRRQSSLNARAAALHLLEDALGWAAVLVVSGVLLVWDLPILDPLLSVIITIYVLYRAAAGLRSTIKLFLQGIPEGFELAGISDELQTLAGVQNVHHTHAWSLDGEHHVFSTHLVVSPETPLADALEIKHRAKHIIAARGFAHVTIEIEYGEQDCSMNDCCDPNCPEQHQPTHSKRADQEASLP